ncbi:sensor histidine kinase [Streptomyces niveiscabiei]|uniref:sensor histidine kinase n=1 Tax=Streptomyces niveiscabiei TaxID=164115 RepID=UPI0029B35EF2|nr:sensor histidine kinase [Streptomyces niveiscabiei]MDX3383204.1 sensor histidine kinase [Streptomyces niveiscabiei]
MRIRPPVRAGLAADVLIAVALAGVSVLLGQEAVSQGWSSLDAPAYALVGLVNLPLALRGRAPVAVCAVVHLVWFCYVTAGYWPVVNSFGPMLAVYTVASLRPVRTSVVCAVAMAGVWIDAGLVSDGGSMASVAGQAVVFRAVLWRFGVIARRSAELTGRLRAEQAERARREVAEERGRIARELHDVVAHHMSVISVQAGLAGFVFDSDRDTARAALSTISGTSAEALDELRRMLRVLRASDEDGAPATPMPGLARLGEMVERVRSGGVRVGLRTEGTVRPLAPGVELCAYRVVQEALTNVLKHAPGAAASLELRYGPRQLEVSVVNDGQGVIPDKVPPGSGHGLMGVRERAKLYGGRVDIGPRGEGGFAVRLTLPTSAPTVGEGGDPSG